MMQTQHSAIIDLPLRDGDVLGAANSPSNTTSSTIQNAGKEDTDHGTLGVADGSSDEAEGDDDDLTANMPSKDGGVSQKKRSDQKALGSWLEQNRSAISTPRQTAAKSAERSTARLFNDLKGERIITSPRDYQLELFEVAKKQNTIAVLDTGSGKTLIAALLLRWIIEKEHEDRAAGQPKRVSFFLVDKVALVFQQYAVLECNLDCAIERFCGDTLDGAGSKGFWVEQLDKHMIIVCTAEILYQCLHHSFVRMEQINLMVFDEAHHTKKNHPYARIIKDFYLQRREETERRPRILGMTASPVDAQVDVLQAAMELEAFLHSRIATPSDPSLLQYNICKPKAEKVVSYAAMSRPFETGLHQSLKKLVGRHDAFRKAFTFTRDASSQLGSWCADWFWRVYFEKEDSGKLEAKTESNYLKSRGIPSSLLDEHLEEVRQARELVENHSFGPLAPHSGELSSKVLVLLNVLTEHFSNRELDSKCIIFVERRYTAIILAALLQQKTLGLQHLQVRALVGAGNADSGYEKVGFKAQLLTIHAFKTGALNCLVATSIAEEGLDIPDCNLVVRFDLYKTTIQYIQSRGRARHEKSTFIHMVERGNLAHQRALVKNLANEQALRDFCQAMPEDRKLSGSNINLEYLLRKEKAQRRYVVPSTGAMLNYQQSLVILAQFVASLPHPPETWLTADYVVNPVPGGYQGEVLLPSASPIRSAMGRQQSSKQAAKCSAAFEMCLELLKGKYLDDHLQPVFTKQLPAMRNARLAISSKKKAQYKMRTKPELWTPRGTPQELHVHVLLLANPAALGRASRPLLLLTRQSMPQIPGFDLFFGAHRSSEARCVPLQATLRMDACLLGLLTSFTLRVFQDIFSKEYEAEPADLPYFLAPGSKSHCHDFGAVQTASEIFDWDALRRVAQTPFIEARDDAPKDFYRDKFVTDPWSGARKFFLRCKRPDLRPQDAVPEGVEPPPHHAWKSAQHDILNYSISLWSKARSKFVWREDQPVVEAEIVSLRRNLLDDSIGLDGPDDGLCVKVCFLVLEPLRISALPVETVAMAYNFPVMMYRIESHLIALDACEMLKLDISPALALEAVTKDSDNTEEHDEEQINFQAGMGSNYERLEFLGDAFLKLATTVALYSIMPDKNEFESHVERMILVCNKNLFNNALDMQLEEYIRSKKFDRGTWYPEGLTLRKGKRHDIKGSHTLADKSIADVCEALIGAAYLTARKEGNFDLAVRAVTAMVKNKNHAMATYAEYYAAYTLPEWQTAPATPMQLDMAKRVADKMGYTFTYPRLLRTAFMHPSYPRSYEHLPSYQRLEFLGDALLDMVCVDYLFDRYPGADPQWLTEHKMAMVSNQFLGCLAVELGFHRHMVAFNGLLTAQVAEYVRDITAELDLARQRAVDVGRHSDDYDRSYWVHAPTAQQPPKCLADLVEAYLGAVFVDSRYDYGTVRHFFTRHVLPYFADMAPYDTFANKHPVTLLAHRLQIDLRCSQWRLCAQEVPAAAEPESAEMESTQIVAALLIHGRVSAHATAASGRYAKIAAAKRAHELLDGLDRERFRAEYGCSCELGSGDLARKIVLDEHGLAI